MVSPPSPSPSAAPPTSKAVASLRRSFPTSTSQSTSTTTMSKGMPGRWRDTLASTLGYSSAPPAAESSEGRGKARGGRERGAIPLFNQGDEGGEEAEVEGAKGELGGEEGAARLEGDDEGLEQQRQRERQLDKLCKRIMYKSPPTSTHSSPLLIIAPCHLPSPPSPLPPPTGDDAGGEGRRRPTELELSQAEVLDCLRRKLEGFSSEIGEEGYKVVLLTSPTPNPPPTALLVSTYLALSRETRKRVKRVWIVGQVGWWMRVLLTLFLSTLLSRKTARKISQVPSLGALAREEEMGAEGFRRLEIPLEVYTANAALEPEIVLPPPQDGHKVQNIFGVELEELMGKDGEVGLPRLVKDCLEVLREKGPESLGIFRRSPSAANVKILQGIYDRGHPLSLSHLPDAPYLAASLLKSFLRELPHPIFPPSFYPLARSCPLPTNPDCVDYIREEILPRLSKAQLVLFLSLAETLHRIANAAETNLMDANNLAVVLTPNLIGGLGASEVELEMCRVPGLETGTMRGVKRREVEREGANSLAGMLRVCVLRYHDIFTPDLLASVVPQALLPPSLSSPSPIISASALSASSPSAPPASTLPLLSPTRSTTALSSPATSRRSLSPSSSPTSSRRPSLASLYEEDGPSSTGPSSSTSTSLGSAIPEDDGAGGADPLAELRSAPQRKGRRPSSASLASSSSRPSRSSSSLSLSLLDTSAGGGSTINGKGKARRSSTVGKSVSLAPIAGREDVRGVFAFGGDGEGDGKEAGTSETL